MPSTSKLTSFLISPFPEAAREPAFPFVFPPGASAGGPGRERVVFVSAGWSLVSTLGFSTLRVVGLIGTSSGGCFFAAAPTGVSSNDCFAGRRGASSCDCLVAGAGRGESASSSVGGPPGGRELFTGTGAAGLPGLQLRWWTGRRSGLNRRPQFSHWISWALDASHAASLYCSML